MTIEDHGDDGVDGDDDDDDDGDDDGGDDDDDDDDDDVIFIHIYIIIYIYTPDWTYMALNIELRHLCQRQHIGDRWRNSIFKQVVRTMHVPKDDPFFCNLLRWFAPNVFSSTSNCLWGT